MVGSNCRQAEHRLPALADKVRTQQNTWWALITDYVHQAEHRLPALADKVRTHQKGLNTDCLPRMTNTSNVQRHEIAMILIIVTWNYHVPHETCHESRVMVFSW